MYSASDVASDLRNAASSGDSDRGTSKLMNDAADILEKIDTPECPCSTCQNIAELAKEPQQSWMREHPQTSAQARERATAKRCMYCDAMPGQPHMTNCPNA